MLATSLAAPVASSASTCAAGASPRCLAAAARPPHQLGRRRRRIRSSPAASSPVLVSNNADRRSASSLRASTSGDVDALPIEGIPPRRGGECDDEVCTVSPAVEATVRSLGRDVARCAGQASFFASKDEDSSRRPRSTWNRVRFSPGVRYTDGFRTFCGVDGYEKLTWIRELLDKPDVTVTRIRMPDMTTAIIEWELKGKLRAPPGGSLAARMTSTFELDQITGRVKAHSEAWDLGDNAATSLTAKITANAARRAWATARAAEDAADRSSKLLDSLSSFDSDDGGEYFEPDPTDPTKFFQGGSDEDQMMKDAFTFAGVLAIFWTLSQAWGQLEGMKF